VTEKCVAGASVTAIALLVPVMLEVIVSVAVMVRLPAVLSVALNVPAPLVSVASAGRLAAPSLLVKWTVPAYPVAVFPAASSAVTVTLNGNPVSDEDGAVTVKWVAAPGATAIAPLVPVMLDVTVSVAVIVLLPAVLSVAEKVPTPLVRVASDGSTAAPSVDVK
jgi:hypothetical protein